MAYRRTKKQTEGKAAIALALISKNPKLSGVLGGLLLTTLIGVFAPSQQVRSLAQNTGCVMGGAFVTFSAYERALEELRAEVKRCRDNAATVAARASELELKAQQLANAEVTMKDRITNQVQSAKNREIERAQSALSRKLATAERQLETSNGKLAKTQLEVTDLKLAHSQQIVAINADAQQAQQAAVDAAIVDKQVELEKVTAAAAVAAEELKAAKQALYRAQQELEAYRGQMSTANTRFNESLVKATQHVFEQQSAVLGEAEKESREATLKTSSELQWEKNERLRLVAENMALKGPKFCTEDTDMGRRCRKLQAAIHGLRNRTVTEKGEVKEISYGFLMHSAGMRREGSNDVFSFRPLTNATGNADELAKHCLDLGTAIDCTGRLKISHNDETGAIDITVPQGHRVPLAEKDVSRVLKSAEAFVRSSASFHRVRITGGSESGKSPLAELIAYSIAQQLDADLHFHNPVANSIKAHMTLPQVSSGDEECLTALLELGADLEAMSKGTKSRPERFQFHVFDEVDTLITGNNEAINAIEIIIKRGSHYGIGIALLGQSDAVSIFQGMTHSDMNNLTQVAIGENARTFISKMQGVSADDKKAMEDKRLVVEEYCNAKNKRLGLRASGPTQDAEALRYCAVKSPNKPVAFFEMPEFGSLNPVPEKTSAAKPAPTASAQIPPKTAPTPNLGCKIAETQRAEELHQSQPNLRSSGLERAELAQDQDGAICAVTEMRLLDLGRYGVNCPHCGEKSSTYVRKRVRKGDSTAEMKCKTDGCASGGKFRAKVITD